MCCVAQSDNRSIGATWLLDRTSRVLRSGDKYTTKKRRCQVFCHEKLNFLLSREGRGLGRVKVATLSCTTLPTPPKLSHGITESRNHGITGVGVRDSCVIGSVIDNANHGITESRGWVCVIRALENLGNLGRLGSVEVATLPLTKLPKLSKLPTLPISLPLCRVAAPPKKPLLYII